MAAAQVAGERENDVNVAPVVNAARVVPVKDDGEARERERVVLIGIVVVERGAVGSLRVDDGGHVGLAFGRDAACRPAHVENVFARLCAPDEFGEVGRALIQRVLDGVARLVAVALRAGDDGAGAFLHGRPSHLLPATFSLAPRAALLGRLFGGHWL